MENSFAEGYAVGVGNSERNSGGFFGNDGIWAILLLALLGNGGWGSGYGIGGGRGGASELFGYQLGQVATTNDIASGFNNSAVLSSLNDIKLGQAQAINYNNQGFSGLAQVINSGFSGVDKAICTLGYNQASLVNGLSRELADCCCATKGAIADLKYSNERQTCDIISAITAGNQRLVDIYTSDKIDTLNRKLASAEAEALTYKNNAYLISQIKEPCPIPAYITPNPNCCYNYAVTGYGYGSRESGCGF